MPKLIIDSIEVEVPPGTNVLEAAKKIGVVIPHFCYHPALGAVGACRLCAMKFIEGPVKGVQVSCMIEAKDGMVVSTTDGEAARLRRMVIEWLMINHPHDCPVCDEGGMCLLQDYTIAGGHGRRRYKGKKRTFSDQYLGEFIRQEMNRCIQCYRCSRFYQDYAGGEDFGPMQTANKVFFGRHGDGWLESEFSGNLADVCPTGVFTDKTARFRFRLWELSAAPSVCPHCSLGCSVTPGAKYRELMRVEARENPAVNGWFICDRGRFGYGFAGRADRPRVPRAHGILAGYDDALRAAAALLRDAAGRHGGNSIAFLGSVRASIESNYALARLARQAGSQAVSFSPDPDRENKDRRAASLLGPGLARSMREMEVSDLIILAGIDPLNEAPMLALSMRQAVLKGAKVIAADPRPIRLPFKFAHVPTPPEALADALSGLLVREAGGGCAPTIIAGTDVGDIALIERAAEAAAELRDKGLDAGLAYIMAGPNSFGCAVLAGGGPDFDDTLDGIERGEIKALVVVQSDPMGRYPDEGRVRRALETLEALIVVDCLPTKTAGMAHVLLPCTAWAEEDGVLVNQEGRAQACARAYAPGIPINAMGPESHPPREFFQETPGAVRPAWEIVMELCGLMTNGRAAHYCISSVRAEAASDYPALGPIAGLDPEGAGVRLGPPPHAPRKAAPRKEAGPGGLTLVVSELTFGTEELSSYSDKANLKTPSPYVALNPADAAALELKDGDAVAVGSGETVFSCALTASGGCAKGVAAVPRLPGWRAAGLTGGRVSIKKLEGA